MAVEYVIVARGNPANPTEPKKFYAHARSSGEVSIRELAKEIAGMSTVSSIDTLAVLEALLQLLPKHIAEGRIVRLGDFGSFGLTISSEGAATEGEVSASLIRNNHIRFRPGREVKRVLDTIQYRKVSS